MVPGMNRQGYFMHIAITQLTYADRKDIRREAKVFVHRQRNAHLGDELFSSDLRWFFKQLRNLIMSGKTLDSALDRIELNFMSMEDM